MIRNIFALLLFATILSFTPGMAYSGQQHVMSAANRGLEIDRGQLRQFRTAFRRVVKSRELPQGWRKLQSGAIRAALRGKSVRSHYLHKNFVIDYAFFPNGTARRHSRSPQFSQNHKWRVSDNNLLAFNLRYDVYTNGKFIALARRYKGRWYGQVFRTGRRITYGVNDGFVSN